MALSFFISWTPDTDLKKKKKGALAMGCYQVVLIFQGKLSLVPFYRTSPSLGALSILNPQLF